MANEIVETPMMKQFNEIKHFRVMPYGLPRFWVLLLHDGQMDRENLLNWPVSRIMHWILIYLN